MTYKTIEGTLHPDGRVAIEDENLPTQPVPVLITFLEPAEDNGLTQLGDYRRQLEDYEQKLARGEIRWQ